MFPTLRPGDVLLCSRRHERWLNAIVIDELRLPGGGITRHIKRLTALSGDIRADRVIPHAHAWIEGDNAAASTDSRRWGPVPYSRLVAVGVALLRDSTLIDVRPRARRKRPKLWFRVCELWLDVWYGLTTRGFIRSDASGFSPAAVHPYAATPWNIARRALDQLQLGPEDVFVDYGCGRGRVLAIALRRGVRRAVGIEIVPALAEDARRNLRRYRTRCEIIEANAAQIPAPDDATVIYVFNAFPTPVLADVVERIRESLSRHPRSLQFLTYGIDAMLLRSLLGVEPRLLTENVLSSTLVAET